jgi:hypothetical protein
VTGTVLQIALALLKLAVMFMDQVKLGQAHQAGVDEEIARNAAKVLRMTNYGKQALEEFTAKPGSADDFLRELEPK